MPAVAIYSMDGGMQQQEVKNHALTFQQEVWRTVPVSIWCNMIES